MKLAFVKVLEKNNVEINELDKDIQLKVREVTQLKNLIESKKRIGQNISADTIEKLKQKDAELVDLLLDSFEYEDEEENNDPDDFQNEETDEDDFNEYGDENLGITIDAELKSAYSNGYIEFSLETMKKLLPNCYDLIWSTYEENQSNGVETSNYKILETPNGSLTFKITKK